MSPIAGDKEGNTSPYEEAGIFSQLFFFWPQDLILKGYSKILVQDDLPPVGKADKATLLNARVLSKWNIELTKEKPSLMRALFYTFAPSYTFTGFYLCLEAFLRIYQAILLGSFVEILLYPEDHDTNELMDNAYFVSFLLTSCGLLVGILHHQYFFHMWRLGMQLRISMTSLIYDKAVVLSMKALSISESSHVVNLSSQDVELFMQFGIFIHYLYVPIIEALVILIFGYLELGGAFIVGFGAIMLLAPIQSFFSKAATKIRYVLATRTDSRIRLISQAINGVRLMKINAWELAFQSIISKARQQEMASIYNLSYIKAMNESLYFCTPVVVGALTFITYSQTGGDLTPQKIFTTLTLFNIIQFDLTKFFPLAVQGAAQAFVATKRIQNLLMLDEISADQREYNHLPPATSLAKVTKSESPPPLSEDGDTSLISAVVSMSRKLADMSSLESTSVLESSPSSVVAISLSNFTASWSVEEVPQDKDTPSEHTSTNSFSVPVPVLQNLNFSIQKGELILVVGPVGSSKSSLLLAMLGELTPTTPTPTPNSTEINSASQDVSPPTPSPPCLTTEGSTSYCSQEPWIMSTTVKENILFGNEYNEKRYQEALTVCDLLTDLAILPAGEDTVIGDKGINLSGGQRARIGLARAVYADTDIVLLDDPLSAVDPKVANVLFHQAICQYLSNTTRVLVTHQVQFLSSSDVSKIIVLDDGAIAAMGTYEELRDDGKLGWIQAEDTGAVCVEESLADDDNDNDVGDVGKDKTTTVAAFSSPPLQSSHSVMHLETSDTCNSLSHSGVQTELGMEMVQLPSTTVTTVYEDEEEGAEEDLTLTRLNTEEGDDDTTMSVSGSVYQAIATGDDALPSQQDKTKASDSEGGAQGITVAEGRAEGEVTRHTYLGYMKQMGGIWIAFFLTSVLVVGQAAVMISTIWLATWSRLEPEEQHESRPMFIYLMLVFLAVFFAIARSILSFRLTLKAATRLHAAMLFSVLRARVLFFDSNPVGRIMNRFSKDQMFIDDILPQTMFDAFQCGLMVLGAVVVVCIGSPTITLILVPIVPIFLYLRRYFIKSSRELKRLDALHRSPLFSHIAESLDGLTTVRAYGAVDVFQREHKRLLDQHTRADFCFMSASRWLGVRLDLIVCLLLAAATFGATFVANLGVWSSPEALVAGVMYVLQLAGNFQWAIRQSAEVENMMVSVERVIGYSHLVSEAPLYQPSSENLQLENWPSKGLIEAKDVICAYRDGAPNVLCGLSFKLLPAQRVGIVGRTGAGKSSLIAVLLRLLELGSGSIHIDGLDISALGLHELRSKISVIPQSPFLFSGSLRDNLDVFSQYSDDDIWKALDCVSIGDVLRRNSDGLAAEISENGSNFSVGERQLLCLARAILQQNKILIMDEATAHVDLDTDALVQQAIHKAFPTSTVIMVAHRILTVIDCHQILVMVDGKITEAGHPHELLTKYGQASADHSTPLSESEEENNKGGVDTTAADTNNTDSNNATVDPPPKHSFAAMVLQLGPTMSSKLRRLAAAAWQEQQQL